MRRRVGKFLFSSLLFLLQSTSPLSHSPPPSFIFFSPYHFIFPLLSLHLFLSLVYSLSLSPYSTGWVFIILHFKLSIGLRFLSHGLCLSIVFHALVLAHSPSCVEQRRSAHAGLYSQHTPMCLVNRWKRIPSECRPISELPCRASGMSELQK